MEKPLLIVGIDPGITVGYALLTLQGNLLHLGAEKELSVNELTRLLSVHGRPLIFGTDKAKTPSTIQQLATTFGAKTVTPRRDLLVSHKRSLIEQYNAEQIVSHEKDALAAAVFARKHYQPLLNRIENTLHDLNHYILFERVTELVIKHSLSIKSALDHLTFKPEEKITEKPTTETHTPPSPLEREIMLLQRANTYLKHQLDTLKTELARSQHHHPTRQPQSHTQDNLLRLRRQLVAAQQQAQRYEHLLLNHAYIIPRLTNLGTYTKIPPGHSLLYVDNPLVSSQRTIKKIPLDTVIISPQKPTTPLTWINAHTLAIQLEKTFAICNEHQIKHVLTRHEVIPTIIEEYRKHRQF